MENADFINTYIDTLNKNLHDLTSRNVVLETKLTVQDKLVSALQTELQNAKNELEKLSKKKITSSE